MYADVPNYGSWEPAFARPQQHTTSRQNAISINIDDLKGRIVSISGSYLVEPTPFHCDTFTPQVPSS